MSRAVVVAVMLLAACGGQVVPEDRPAPGDPSGGGQAAAVPLEVDALCDRREEQEPDQWYAVIDLAGLTEQQAATAHAIICRTDGVDWQDPNGSYRCEVAGRTFVGPGSLTVMCPEAYSVQPPFVVRVITR